MTKLFIERDIIERVLDVMENEGCAGFAYQALREALAEQAEQDRKLNKQTKENQE